MINVFKNLRGGSKYESSPLKFYATLPENGNFENIIIQSDVNRYLLGIFFYFSNNNDVPIYCLCLAHVYVVYHGCKYNQINDTQGPRLSSIDIPLAMVAQTDDNHKEYSVIYAGNGDRRKRGRADCVHARGLVFFVSGNNRIIDVYIPFCGGKLHESSLCR